jgi:PAS domain-containing protein
MKFKKILCYHVLGILLATSFVIMLIGSFRENLSVITVLYRSSIILTLVFIAALLEKNKKSINPGSSYDSHKLMQYFIEHTKDAMAILDTELRYLYASQSYYSDFRIKKKNIIGMFHSDVFPHFPDAWKNIPPRVFAGEILSGEDNAFELEDGTREWTKWECRPWYKEDNTIGGMIVYSERITEAKQMVQALQEREKRYTSLFEKNNATILLIDGENLNIVDANPAACKYYGWSREELIQKKNYRYQSFLFR